MRWAHGRRRRVRSLNARRPHRLISTWITDARDGGSPGDILTVPRAPHIGVVGAVEKPGDVTLHGDGSLLSAIYNAGGPSRNANLSSVAVVHNGVRTEYNVISAIHGGDGTVMLADGDTVFVPVGHKVDFSAFWQAVGRSAP